MTRQHYGGVALPVQRGRKGRQYLAGLALQEAERLGKAFAVLSEHPGYCRNRPAHAAYPQQGIAWQPAFLGLIETVKRAIQRQLREDADAAGTIAEADNQLVAPVFRRGSG